VNTHPSFTSRGWAGWPAVLLCRPTVSFGTTRTPIHLHIHDGNRFAHHHGQIQLHGRLNLSLLACSDILADGFCRALHGLDGHLQVGEQLHPLPPVIARHILAHGRL